MSMRLCVLILILTSFSLVDHASALRPVVDHAMLLKAVESGDIVLVKYLINNGTDVDYAIVQLEKHGYDSSKAGIKMLERLMAKKEIASQPSQAISK